MVKGLLLIIIFEWFIYGQNPCEDSTYLIYHENLKDLTIQEHKEFKRLEMNCRKAREREIEVKAERNILKSGYNPCNDIKYLTLKEKRIDSLSERESQYLSMAEKDCDEYRDLERKANINMTTDKANALLMPACEDSLYRILKGSDINSLTQNEMAYFLAKDAACIEEMKQIEIKAKEQAIKESATKDSIQQEYLWQKKKTSISGAIFFFGIILPMLVGGTIFILLIK